MLAKNDVVILEITAPGTDGMFVGRYSGDGCDGFVVYVPFCAVGDVIECRILKMCGSYAYGRVEKVVTPAASRICDAGCAVYGRCGGCAYRHISYEAELACKRELAVSAYRYVFGRDAVAGGSITVNDTVPSPLTDGYRNKAQYPITPDGKCGFYSRLSHRTVPVAGCALQSPLFRPVIEAFEKYVRDCGVSVYDENTRKGLLRHLCLRAGEMTGDIAVCVVVTADKLPREERLADALFAINGIKSFYVNVNSENTNVVLGKKFRLVRGEPTVSDTLCGIRFGISPDSFYQINRSQAEKLYNFALDIAGLSGDETFLDLYCGIGGIALAASKRVKHAVGVEIVPAAVADAKRCAAENGITNVSFYAADADSFEEVLRTAGESKPDVVAVDPPRKGIGADTVDALCRLLPQKIVYISCNPRTQASDIKLLAEKAAEKGACYELGSVTPFDMFPRTAHVETVVLLSKKI